MIKPRLVGIVSRWKAPILEVAYRQILARESGRGDRDRVGLDIVVNGPTADRSDLGMAHSAPIARGVDNCTSRVGRCARILQPARRKTGFRAVRSRTASYNTVYKDRVSFWQHDNIRGKEMATTASDTAARTTASSGTRWAQLVCGIICMVMIANLQYGWNLFVNPIDAKFHWGRAAIQVAFSLFVLTETWLYQYHPFVTDARPVGY